MLDAARAEFGRLGYGATRIRDVAARAEVDPALVHYYFGSKGALFAAAMALPMEPAEVVRPVLEGDRDTIGERLALRFLAIWDDPAQRQGVLGLLRSAATHQDAADSVRDYVEDALSGALTRALGVDQPARRAALTASQLIGLAWARHILRLDTIATDDARTVARAVGPTLQRYLTGPLD